MVRNLEDVEQRVEYEASSQVIYQTMKEKIKAADKYIINIPNQEKSITLLDGATARAAEERGKTIINPKERDN